MEIIGQFLIGSGLINRQFKAEGQQCSYGEGCTDAGHAVAAVAVEQLAEHRAAHEAAEK